MARPRLYNTSEELEDKISEYFNSLNKDDGSSLMATMSGLALYLGFASRQSLNDYEKDERFSYLIKKARLSIESAWEQMLTRQSCTGAIFWLKNHAGYTDKQEISANEDKPFSLKIEYVSKKE